VDDEKITNDKGIYTEEMAKNEASKINSEIAVLKKVRNFTEYFLLNLDRLWDRLTEPAMKQALQNKIFPQGIVCTKDKKIRTAGLSPSFELIRALNTAPDTIGEGTGMVRLAHHYPNSSIPSTSSGFLQSSFSNSISPVISAFFFATVHPFICFSRFSASILVW